MKKASLRPRAAAAVLIAAFVLAGATSAFAFDKRFELARARNEGWFTCLTLRPELFWGDFRTDLTLWHFDKTFYIPRLTHAGAVTAGVGLGRKSAYTTWEVRYSLTLPQASVGGDVRGIQIHELEFIGRSFIWPGRILQPYGMLGIDLPLVIVKDGASYLGEPLNAAYVAVGLEAGGGVVWDFAPNMFLDLGISYRFQGYFYAYGEGKGRDINHLRTVQNGPKLERLMRNSGLALTLGLGFMF